MRRLSILASAAVVAVGVATPAASAAPTTGPSSSQTPYLVPLNAGASFTSVLTVGDAAANGYRMSGVADGLGAYGNGDGTFTVLMNHELGTDAAGAPLGVVRAHGGAGAFVSKWTIRKSDLAVVAGEDLIRDVYLWDGTGYALASGVSFSRFCSADLPARSAFWNSRTRRGTQLRLFMNGEEKGPEGRAFAHGVDGRSWELPRLGKLSFENVLANPGTGDRTVVIGNDDQGSGKGQIYLYAGTKQRRGNPVERAGLANGDLYGIAVAGFPAEVQATGIPAGTRFTTVALGDVTTKTGAELETLSNTLGVTQFRRPEDGAWDPRNRNVYYFATTDSYNLTTGRSRLWRLTFDDARHPELGGTIAMLLDGTEGQQMLDNLTAGRDGRIVLQEDIGEQPARGRVWLYDTTTDGLTLIGEHDPARFTPGEPGFITADEESSGVIDVSRILGRGTYLLAQQAHSPWAPAPFTAPSPLPFPYSDPALVEGGQLVALRLAVPAAPRRHR